MKIPKDTFLIDTVKLLWHETASRLSMEYGIFIDVKYKHGSSIFIIEEIVFEIEGKEFGSLKQLEKALENSALL